MTPPAGRMPEELRGTVPEVRSPPKASRLPSPDQ